MEPKLDLSLDQFKLKADEIRKLKTRMHKLLASDINKLKNAAFSTFFDVLQQHPEMTEAQIMDAFATSFNLPATETTLLKQHLSSMQRSVAKHRAALMKSVGVEAAEAVPLQQLQAMFQIDFPRINQGVNRQVINTIQRSIVQGRDSSALVFKALKETKVLTHQAQSLANTALAMFDNAHAHATAQAGGIDTFELVGAPPQRAWCVEHYEKQYTRAEIDEMDNGQGLEVYSSCGGYRCRHEWLAVPDFMID